MNIPSLSRKKRFNFPSCRVALRGALATVTSEGSEM